MGMSVKVTERHYAPWVKARQAQLEYDLVRAWQNDPILQAETLRGDAAKYAPAQQTPATYQRHKNREVSN